ncbi:MAG: glycosyltransferase, partial [Alphaproteobacteria bacterium]
VVSRLTTQKGIDLILDKVSALVDAGGQLAILGSGDEHFEAGFVAAARDYPGRVATVIGYDEPLAHQLQAGSDYILVPSRFEPCGLTQLCGLRYGTLPLVARVGGLADTIIDANEAALATGTGTGVQFAPTTGEAFGFALDRAFALWRDETAFARLRRNAMKQDVSWAAPARRYMDLYRALLASD